MPPSEALLNSADTLFVAERDLEEARRRFLQSPRSGAGRLELAERYLEAWKARRESLQAFQVLTGN